MEKQIQKAIEKNLNSGKIEEIVSEQFEKAIKDIVQGLFRWGDVHVSIEEKIKSVLLPAIDSYDYSKYIVTLDEVLQEILKQNALPHKKLIENFKKLMIPVEIKEIKLSDVFNEYKKFVSKNVETSELEVDYDDEPSYEEVEVSLEVLRNGAFSNKVTGINFTCEKDENMNVYVATSDYFSDDKVYISYETPKELKALRYMNDFDVFILSLEQNDVKIIIDVEELEDFAEIEEKPYD
ncbi:hypothetical protein SAMN02745116_02543 [Pilibacter termitis]|uniref:Uncharacterized protein n=1 Tax=Pilibacter termitis TaxID=263852 RepID=A0A1T4RCS6_9ENTE|nr:DUF871 domain-containing protein [Pilibacter termitis]SKA13753.1 hypothetical protein SAMN02745116_02543 [Pilibacter termitis]